MDRRFAWLWSRLSRPIEGPDRRPEETGRRLSRILVRYRPFPQPRPSRSPRVGGGAGDPFDGTREIPSPAATRFGVETINGASGPTWAEAGLGREDGIVDPEAIVPPINDERSLREHHQRYNLACPADTSIPRVPGVLRSHSSDDVLDLQAFCAFYVFHASGFFIASHNNIGLR